MRIADDRWKNSRRQLGGKGKVQPEAEQEVGLSYVLPLLLLKSERAWGRWWGQEDETSDAKQLQLYLV